MGGVGGVEALTTTNDLEQLYIAYPTILVYVNELTPYPGNYQHHPKEQVKGLADSLTSFQQFKPIVVWRCPRSETLPDGLELHEGLLYIICGHGLWQGAMEAGVDRLEAKDISGVSREVAEAILWADNASVLGAEPIADKLAALLERTRHLTADKPGLAGMLAALRERAGVNGNGKTPPEETPIVDKAEELQKKWKVKPGDIWQIADHFIICGDCREADTWARLLGVAGVEKVNGVFTSPPYAEQRKAQYGGVPTGEYVEWWEAVQGNVRAWLTGDGSFFVNIKPHCEDGQRVLYVFDLVLAMVRAWGWRFVDELCWLHEGIPGQWNNRLKNRFEPVYQFSIGDTQIRHNTIKHKSDRAGRYTATDGTTSQGNVGFSGWVGEGLAIPGNVIEINHGIGRDDNAIHPAKFPIALPTFFLKAYSDPGDVWLDPFLGSGTTIVACHNEGRRGLGIEKLEKYCAVILERLATLTQQQPRLVSG